jgi:hypothetical protein
MFQGHDSEEEGKGCFMFSVQRPGASGEGRSTDAHTQKFSNKVLEKCEKQLCFVAAQKYVERMIQRIIQHGELIQDLYRLTADAQDERDCRVIRQTP